MPAIHTARFLRDMLPLLLIRPDEGFKIGTAWRRPIFAPGVYHLWPTSTYMYAQIFYVNAQSRN
jgi:hypothetical protein